MMMIEVVTGSCSTLRSTSKKKTSRCIIDLTNKEEKSEHGETEKETGF